MGPFLYSEKFMTQEKIPLSIMAVHAHPDDETTSGGSSLVKYGLEGVQTIVVTCTDGAQGEMHDPDLDPEWALPRLAEIRRGEMERAAKRGLRVGFEALAWGRHISDYRDAWEVVRRADHSAIGLVLDSFHTFARKTDLKQLRSIPGDRIFLVQLADAPWLDMDVLSWSRHFRCFPGQGDMPIVEFMQALLATGYDGPLSLEIFNDLRIRRVPIDVDHPWPRMVIRSQCLLEEALRSGCVALCRQEKVNGCTSGIHCSI